MDPRRWQGRRPRVARPGPVHPLAIAAVVSGLLATPTGALALDPTKTLTQYAHDVWRTDQGLPQNSVQCILQTRDGYLWLGTEEGLARFDGVRFVVFDRRNTPELRHSAILRLIEGRDGSLWIGTDGGGLARLKDRRFTSYTTREGLSNDFVRSLCEGRDGSLWIGTRGGGLNRLKDGRFTITTTRQGLPNDQVQAIVELRDGSLLVGTNGGGLCRLEDGKVSTHVPGAGLRNRKVQEIHEGSDGSVWIGTDGGGLVRLRNEELTSWTVAEGLSNDRVSAISEDRDGNLWIGTAGGLNRLKDGHLTAIGTRDGLSDDAVVSLCEDREGSLWIGTFTGGLNRLRESKLTSVTTKDGLSGDVVLPIFEDHAGALWIGTGRGLNRLKDGVLSAYTARDGLVSDQVWSIAEDRQGGLWIGTNGGGLCRLKDGRFTPFTSKQGLSDDHVLSILEDRTGGLWIGTNGGGLNHLRHGKLSVLTTKDGLTNDSVWAIHEDRAGVLWLGTRGGGLNRLAGGKVTALTTKEGLSNDQVYAIHEDGDGVLWIGTAGGLNRLRDGQLARFTSKDGLFDDVVLQVLEDRRGNLWMSCNRGIFMASKADLNAFAAGSLARIPSVSYGTSDGMGSAECNGGQPAGCTTRDGRLWFPTMKGVVVVDPERIPVNSLAPPVTIEDFDADGIPQEASRSLALAPGIERLDFRYTALSLAVPTKVRFRYRLEGFDRGWVNAGTERTAHYTNLPPRSYVFRVTGCNDDGVWNETGASLTFTLRPHVWQTPWFYGLVVVALIGSGFGVQRARVARLKVQRAALSRLVEERTRSLAEEKERAEAVSRKLEEAQQRISRLLESSPGASQSLLEWSRSIAEEIAGAIGADGIGIWEVEEDRIAPLSDCGLSVPSLDELRALLLADAQSGGTAGAPGLGRSRPLAGAGSVVAVTGPSGELCGALVVAGSGVSWGETERRLVGGFAHQLGGALEVVRMRRRLAAAEERRAFTKREMQERGIATLQICPSCGRCTDDSLESCSEDGSRLETPHLLPFRLLGRYRFEQLLGQGGMGIVLAAHDEKLDRDVAIKLIRPEHFGNTDLRLRFEREARTVARIQHPGIVALYDSGDLQDSTAFLVMEKLAGSDLAQLLRHHGRGTPRQVAELVRQGSAALRAAHRAGVVHRDVKPENVFLVDDSPAFRVKVVDFGLAKTMTAEKGLTRAGMVVGTPAYMSPEQIQGEEVDARSDVYSFAAVCYEALVGERAIPGDDLGTIMINVLGFTPPLVSSKLLGMPAEVDLAFVSALSKERGRRLRDIDLWASSFVDTLERAPVGGTEPGWPTTRKARAALPNPEAAGAGTLPLPPRGDGR